MSQPREPVRWADPASESDPVLRRLLGDARADVGDAALADRIERAVQTHVATTKRNWRPWVGVAALCLTFGGAALGLRSPAPGPRVGPAKPSDTSAGDVRSASAIAADITEGRTTQQLSETSAANSGGIRSASATAEDTNAARTKQAAASSDSVRSASAAAPPARISEERARRTIQQPNDPNGARTQERRLGQPARAERERTNRRAQLPGAAAASEQDDMRSAARTNIDAARRDVASRDTENHDGDETYKASARQPSAAIVGRVSPSMSPDQTAVPPELTLISAAQRALRDSPKEALALTEQHVRAYPNGGFQEEREEIAISALFALGRQTSARTRAQTFLSQHPRALSAPRIQKLLDTSR